MRRPSLARWLRREVCWLCSLDTFSLRRASALAQGECPRAVESLFLLCLLEERLSALKELVYRDDVHDSYDAAEAALRGVDVEKAALGDALPAELDRGYAKVLRSWVASYRRPEAVAESKRLRWERSRRLQLEKGISTADICRELGLNRGNVNSYLKHGDVGRISLEGATQIMRYLAQC